MVLKLSLAKEPGAVTPRLHPLTCIPTDHMQPTTVLHRRRKVAGGKDTLPARAKGYRSHHGWKYDAIPTYSRVNKKQGGLKVAWWTAGESTVTVKSASRSKVSHLGQRPT